MFQQFGLDIQGDWSKLIGVSMQNGDFVHPDGIYVSSVLMDDTEILKFYIDLASAELSSGDPSSGRLCFLY